MVVCRVVMVSALLVKNVGLWSLDSMKTLVCVFSFVVVSLLVSVVSRFT